MVHVRKIENTFSDLRIGEFFTIKNNNGYRRTYNRSFCHNGENYAVVFANPCYNRCHDFKPFHSYEMAQQTVIEKLGTPFIVANLENFCSFPSSSFDELDRGTMFYDKKADLIGYKANLSKLYGSGVLFFDDATILNAIMFKYTVEDQYLKLTEFSGAIMYSKLSQLFPLTGKCLNIPV